jgi:hypothetical protein
MPLDLPPTDAGLSFTGVWVARPRPAEGEWEFGPIETAEVDGQLMGLAWSDEIEAYEQLPSAQHELFEMSVSAVLGSLPVGAGLVIDPRAPSPRVVEPEDRDRVKRLGFPWTPAVPYLLHEVEDVEVDGFLSDLREVLPRYPQLGRVWCVGYEVVGGPAVPMLVADEYFVDLSSCSIEAMELGGGFARVELALLEDVPAEARGWFDEHPPLNA